MEPRSTIPHTGLSAVEQDELNAFADRMGEFSKVIGSDGKPAFAIPMAYSSSDQQWRALDTISFSRWLDQQGWTSPAMRRHVRYCCRDDYGTEPEQVSAWAGIHYFAARRGWGAGDSGDNELTWPEGNAWLARWLAGRSRERISSRQTVFAVRHGEEGVGIDSFDTSAGASLRTWAKATILATPYFITTRLMPGLGSAKSFSYAPWLVANVTVDRPPAGRGALLAWDNVSGASESLGYVVATHQSASRPGPTVLSWYLPLSRQSPADARKDLLTRPAEHWQAMVRDDLLAMNPDLKGAIRRIDLWRWGHGMIRPEPGFLFGIAPSARALARPPVFLAHSDLSGLSLFEEAHYRGVLAAEDAMRHLGHPFETML
jgi:hypothetical protein